MIPNNAQNQSFACEQKPTMEWQSGGQYHQKNLESTFVNALSLKFAWQISVMNHCARSDKPTNDAPHSKQKTALTKWNGFQASTGLGSTGRPVALRWPWGNLHRRQWESNNANRTPKNPDVHDKIKN